MLNRWLPGSYRGNSRFSNMSSYNHGISIDSGLNDSPDRRSVSGRLLAISLVRSLTSVGTGAP